MEKVKCPHCNKEFSSKGIGTHIWRSHGDGKNHNPNKGYEDGTRRPTNQFLAGTATGHSDDTIKKISEKASQRKNSPESNAKRSVAAIKNKLGGVHPSKHIDYKGKKLGSTYELELVKDLDKNNIRWDTCKRIKYKSPDGKQRTYTPDIYLVDYDVYLDPKNDFLIDNINPRLGFKDCDKIKWVCEQNNVIVHILNKNQLSWEYLRKLI